MDACEKRDRGSFFVETSWVFDKRKRFTASNFFPFSLAIKAAQFSNQVGFSSSAKQTSSTDSYDAQAYNARIYNTRALAPFWWAAQLTWSYAASIASHPNGAPSVSPRRHSVGQQCRLRRTWPLLQTVPPLHKNLVPAL